MSIKAKDVIPQMGRFYIVDSGKVMTLAIINHKQIQTEINTIEMTGFICERNQKKVNFLFYSMGQ